MNLAHAIEFSTTSKNGSSTHIVSNRLSSEGVCRQLPQIYVYATWSSSIASTPARKCLNKSKQYPSQRPTQPLEFGQWNASDVSSLNSEGCEPGIFRPARIQKNPSSYYWCTRKQIDSMDIAQPISLSLSINTLRQIMLVWLMHLWGSLPNQSEYL